MHANLNIIRMSWKEILTLKDWFSYRQKIGLLVVAAKYGHTGEIPVPDYSTKAKAQEAIGLDMQKLNEKKQRFMDGIVPKWIDEAKKNGKLIEL